MLPEALVKRLISEILDVDEDQLTADRRLDTFEEWDSVSALRVMVYLERELRGPIDYTRFMAAERLGDFWLEARKPAVTP